MSSARERYQRLHAIFDAAKACAPAERRAYLDDACAGDDALRADVERLLKQSEERDDCFADAQLEQSRHALEGILLGAHAPTSDLTAPTQVGQYRLQRVIGEGGMGLVYEAEQIAPRRRVALKLIPPHRATPERLRRFRQEAELLGRLQHPGIAQIHEAGTFDAGNGAQPFFAMEYVDGDDVRSWCDRQRLIPDAILRLVAEIADAVHYAHERGVIHRDLKPENIFIDHDGRVKVLDFGVARASEATTAVTTIVTHAGQMVGTLAYMAPEQLSAHPDAITPRVDVYALGTLLFELLTGRLPHDLAGLSTTAAIRVLSERDAPRLGRLDSRFRGDVETIVARALEKDPARRYESAAALAADLRRTLDDRPIVARPPSRAYTARKFVRRHRPLVIGTTATIVALVIGLAVALVLAANEREQRELAERLNARLSTLSASRSLADDDPQSARTALNDAPPAWRGWEWDVLHAQVQDVAPPVATLARRSWSIAASPTGDRLATIRRDRTIEILDTRDWQVVTTIDVPITTTRFQFARDGRTLISTGITEGRIHVCTWDTTTGECTDESMIGSGNQYATVATIESNRDHLLVADNRGVLRLDRRTGARLAASRMRDDGAVAPVISPDGRWLASGSRSGTIELLDATTLEDAARLVGHATTAQHVAFTPDSQMLASASYDGTVRVWDLTVMPPRERHRLDLGTSMVEVAVSPSGRFLAARGETTSIHVWELPGGAPLARLRGHPATSAGIAFLPDDRLVSIGTAGDVRVWSLPPVSSEVRLAHASFVYGGTYADDGRVIITAGWDGLHESGGQVRWWDAATGAPIAAWRDGAALATALALSPDESTLVVAMTYGHGVHEAVSPTYDLVLVDARTGTVRRRIPTASRVYNLDIAPDGRRFLAGGNSGDIAVYDLETGANVRRIERDPIDDNPYSAAIWSPDGALIASICTDGTIELRDAETGDLLRSWTAHTTMSGTLRFSPDGATLVSLGQDGAVRVWDAATGAAQAAFTADALPLTAAFSPDGTRLATGRRDGVIRLYDTATWQQVAELHGHDAYVYHLAWSRDGARLLSTSGDHTARQWDARRDDVIRTARTTRAAAVVRLEPIVAEIRRANGSPAAALDAIDADASLTPDDRHLARQLVLRAAGPPDASSP